MRRGASGEGESFATASLSKTKLSMGLRGRHFGCASGGTAGRVIGWRDQWVWFVGGSAAWEFVTGARRKQERKKHQHPTSNIREDPRSKHQWDWSIESSGHTHLRLVREPRSLEFGASLDVGCWI